MSTKSQFANYSYDFIYRHLKLDSNSFMQNQDTNDVYVLRAMDLLSQCKRQGEFVIDENLYCSPRVVEGSPTPMPGRKYSLQNGENISPVCLPAGFVVPPPRLPTNKLCHVRSKPSRSPLQRINWLSDMFIHFWSLLDMHDLWSMIWFSSQCSTSLYSKFDARLIMFCTV